MSNFDMDRLRELHRKSEREGLTKEERQEVVSMTHNFNESLGKALQPVVEAYGELGAGFAKEFREVFEELEGNDD